MVTYSWTDVNYFDTSDPTSNGTPAFVEVKLFDSKWVNVLASASTPTYQFTAGTCPISGTLLGTYSPS